MKILITGALGHIGSGLIKALPIYIPDIEIVLIDNLMTNRFCSLFNLPENGNYTFIENDINKINLLELLKDINIVIHLAAITDAAGSFNRAKELEENNYSSTKKIGDACSILGIKLITLSSTSVYGSQKNVVDEDCPEDDLKPQSPYALSKLKEEKYINNLVINNALKAVILRFGTIFGVSAGMRFHTAVNKFCWQAIMEQPLTIWTTAYQQKRPYLDLNDAIMAFIFIIKNDMFDGRIYNVVTTNTTVEEIVSTIGEFVPSLEITFVDNEIMNQLSYEVSTARFIEKGFITKGDIKIGISQTLSLLRQSNNQKDKI